MTNPTAEERAREAVEANFYPTRGLSLTTADTAMIDSAVIKLTTIIQAAEQAATNAALRRVVRWHEGMAEEIQHWSPEFSRYHYDNAAYLRDWIEGEEE